MSFLISDQWLVPNCWWLAQLVTNIRRCVTNISWSRSQGRESWRSLFWLRDWPWLCLLGCQIPSLEHKDVSSDEPTCLDWSEGQVTRNKLNAGTSSPEPWWAVSGWLLLLGPGWRKLGHGDIPRAAICSVPLHGHCMPSGLLSLAQKWCTQANSSHSSALWDE
jgi:hypothetical protein